METGEVFGSGADYAAVLAIIDSEFFVVKIVRWVQ